MSSSYKIKKVTIEYEDETISLDADQAEKWSEHLRTIESVAMVHGVAPFDSDPVVWDRVKHDNKIGGQHG